MKAAVIANSDGAKYGDKCRIQYCAKSRNKGDAGNRDSR